MSKVAPVPTPSVVVATAVYVPAVPPIPPVPLPALNEGNNGLPGYNIPLTPSDDVKFTAKIDESSILVILPYFTLLEGKVPGAGFNPFVLIKSIEVVLGTVTILLS